LKISVVTQEFDFSQKFQVEQFETFKSSQRLKNISYKEIFDKSLFKITQPFLPFIVSRIEFFSKSAIILLKNVSLIDNSFEISEIFTRLECLFAK
jgi:hypothetical protein